MAFMGIYDTEVRSAGIELGPIKESIVFHA